MFVLTLTVLRVVVVVVVVVGGGVAPKPPRLVWDGCRTSASSTKQVSATCFRLVLLGGCALKLVILGHVSSLNCVCGGCGGCGVCGREEGEGEGEAVCLCLFTREGVVVSCSMNACTHTRGLVLMAVFAAAWL